MQQPRIRKGGYEIILGKSRASADEAASDAQDKTNAAGGEAIGIAGTAKCCPGKDGTLQQEFDVFVLIHH